MAKQYSNLKLKLHSNGNGHYLRFFLNNDDGYYFFLTVTCSSLVSIIHSIVSPLCNSKKSLTNAGTVVVKEPDTDCSFVSYFNFIPPII